MAHETTLERPLPQNLDAERSVLGAILLDNHSLNNALEKLKPEDFFQNMHQIIFTQMIELGERQQAIDLVTLADQLHRRGQLEAAGGAAYLAQLVDGVPRVGHMEHYARIIKEKSLLRHLIHATHEIQQTAMEADEDPDAILDRAESSIFQLAEDRVRVGPGAHERRGARQHRAARAHHHRGQTHHGAGDRVRAAGQPNLGAATFRADHSGGAAFSGKNSDGAEHR